MPEGDRDELEAELWRLRSVEYDLQQARAEIQELKVRIEGMLNEFNETMGRNGILEKKLETGRSLHRETERQLSDAKNAHTKTRQKLRTALEDLARIDANHYMSENYGFEITNKLPGRTNPR